MEINENKTRLYMPKTCSNDMKSSNIFVPLENIDYNFKPYISNIVSPKPKSKTLKKEHFWDEDDYEK